MALRIQQLLGFESGVADVVDPVGGSYFVEVIPLMGEGDYQFTLELEKFIPPETTPTIVTTTPPETTPPKTTTPPETTRSETSPPDSTTDGD